MKRDLYIDFAKGFATLSIIFIHTAFWSGQLYIPKEIRILSLLIDVPVFFALSGLTSSGNVDKTFYRLLKLQVTYMIFVTFLFFFDSFFKVFLTQFFDAETFKNFFLTFGTRYTPNNLTPAFHWETLGNWWLHQYSNCDTFPVVMGSFWYLKTYYIVTVLGVLTLRFFPKHIHWIIAVCIGLTIYFNIDNNIAKNYAPNYPTGQVGYVAYYLCVFLIANLLKGKKIESKFIPMIVFFVITSLAAVFWAFGQDIFYAINKQKFPPKIPYIVWSFISLATVMLLYNRFRVTKDNFVNYIGKNAIFYYFAQGISSSLVYFIIVPLKESMHWAVLMVLIYVLNVALAIGLAEIIKKIDALGWKTLENLRLKTKMA